jgi:hypothetical protein
MKEQILRLRSEGKTYKEISQITGKSKGTIAYHCGDNQKEKASIRREKNRTATCSCGNKKSKISEVCNDCRVKERRDALLNRTIESCMSHKNPFVHVRKVARVLMEESGREKKCAVCGFDAHVEVCHIKPISQFDRETLLLEVNSFDNLVYLCPNHHTLLDMGLISL